MCGELDCMPERGESVLSKASLEVGGLGQCALVCGEWRE